MLHDESTGAGRGGGHPQQQQQGGAGDDLVRSASAVDLVCVFSAEFFSPTRSRKSAPTRMTGVFYMGKLYGRVSLDCGGVAALALVEPALGLPERPRMLVKTGDERKQKTDGLSRTVGFTFFPRRAELCETGGYVG